jgi:2-enoate reductase
MENGQERLRKVIAGVGTWYHDDARMAKGRMTKNLYPYRELFSPIQINKLTVRNRIVMAPMGNINMADETGRPGSRMVEYFAARARGGVGLITSGLVHVSQGIDPSVTEPGGLSYFPRIDRTRSVFSGWRDIVDRCMRTVRPFSYS